MTETVYKVSGIDMYVRHVNEFSNGIETTGGFYRPDELAAVDFEVDITFDSDHAALLPVDWHSHNVLDDKNRRQRIASIHFDRAYSGNPAYQMEDGTLSYAVTIGIL